MKHVLPVITSTGLEEEGLEIRQSLDKIERKLDTEITAKQKTIEKQEEEIRRLQGLMDEKNRLLLQAEDKLKDNGRKSEGSRQLINKLINDIERLNQDIEWYKRTFEKRSLAGLIKYKFKSIFSK